MHSGKTTKCKSTGESIDLLADWIYLFLFFFATPYKYKTRHTKYQLSQYIEIKPRISLKVAVL